MIEKNTSKIKTKIGLFFGGLGNEAEVSVLSAKNVAENFDYEKYELALIYWHKDRFFYRVKNFSEIKKPTRRIKEENFAATFDIALPETHGRFGEDGILQSIFERHGIKYCGCRVLSSALCMDKAVCKNYLSGYDIRQTKFEVIDFDCFNKKEISLKLQEIENTFKLPLFIKPANSGSSVGITKVSNIKSIKNAINTAQKHDHKIVIEEGLEGVREIEVGILGNAKIIVSRPGELIPGKEFYDYEDKYENGKTKIIIPAKLTANQEENIVLMAKKIYRLFNCSGFARLDFFIAKNKIYFNEINTLPGFTKSSMYPMLMMNSKMTYKELINKIIELAR